MIRKLLALMIVLALAACASPAPAVEIDAAPLPDQNLEQPTSVPLPIVPELTLEQIKESIYQPQMNYDEAPVQLSGGVFQRIDDSAAPLDVRATDYFVNGDLNGDTASDLAVIFYESAGGSGTFVYLVIYLNQNGQPEQFASVLLGDRVQINWLTLEGPNVVVDLFTQGPADAMISPTMPQTQVYSLTNRGLEMIHQSQRLADDRERIVLIESPSTGSDAFGAAQIKGSVTIAPFENNLVYRIIDPAGEIIAYGPITVSAPDIGAPGTFEASIDLAGIPAESIRIQILDISAADGSILALDSIVLNVK
jgi:hypothetical protein